MKYLVVGVGLEAEALSWIEIDYQSWVSVLALAEVCVDSQLAGWLLQMVAVVKTLLCVDLA